MKNYKLSTSLIGHSLDVRGIESDNNDRIYSAARDGLVLAWKKSMDNTYEIEKKYEFHKGFVICIYYLPPTNEFPEGLICSGGVDKIINVFEPSSEQPIYMLIDHEDTVCSISSTPNGAIISGSWDSTAKVWIDWKCQYTLRGHSLAVWSVLGLHNNKILTASADKSIKLWENEKCIKTFVGHTDCVRGLSEIPGIGFVSCSNDGVIRMWDLGGNCLNELYGHTSFIYCVKYNPMTEEIYSCGEDRSLKIWKDGECKQTIVHPAISVWCVSVLKNGDIATGSSDNNIRIFTTSDEKIADESQIKAFEDSVAKFAVSSNSLGNINKKDIRDISELNNPGSKDQQTIMVKNGDSIEAHQWSESEKKWIKIGVVVDTVSSNKKLFEGKEYDYIFDIDVGDGSILRLPYNATENPYEAAQKFIWKHNLSQNFLDQIGTFIIKNSEPVTIGQSTTDSTLSPFSDGRYIPGSSAPIPRNNNVDNSKFIPNRYIPGGSNSTNQTISTPNEIKYIPKTGYTIFKAGDGTKIISKLIEFNEKVKTESQEKALDEKEVEYLSDIVILLENPSIESFNKGFKNQHLEVLKKICQTWNLEYRFPGLDLLRLCTLYSPLPIQNENSNLIIDIIKNNFPLSERNKSVENKIQITSMMFILRFISNMFGSKIGREIIKNNKNLIMDCIKNTIDIETNNFYKLALITTLLNFTVMIKDDKNESEFALLILQILRKLIEKETFQENQFRLCIAIGNLLCNNSEIKEAGKLLSFSRIIDNFKNSNDEKVRNVSIELKKYL